MALKGVVTTKTFVDRATVWVLAHVYNADGDLVDPTSIKISIYDPDGTLKVDAASMTQYAATTGIYEYKYHMDATADAMAKGKWRILGDVIDGTGATAVISPFNSGWEVN